MIQDYLLFRARLSPEDPATLGSGPNMTFRELCDRVRAVAAELRRRRLPRGAIVVTCVSDKALDWVLTLAIQHEALVSCSNLGYAAVDAFAYDLLITDRFLAHGTPEKTWLVDAAALSTLPAPGDALAPVAFGNLDDTIRLFMTSGTTGQRKVVPLAARPILERLKSRALVFEPQRILTPMPLGAAVGYNNALLALMRGAPLYCEQSADQAAALIDAQAIECFYGSPVQIAGLIRAVASRGAPLESLRVVKSTGGPISDRLIRDVRKFLCPMLINEYGATETGGAAICLPQLGGNAAVTGFPLPGCEIQIVDAHDQPLGPGEEGIVRTRTPYMAAGYHANPEQTAQSFRDGFFYPGDRGTVSALGELTLAGRETEIINRGGVKIDPAEIDRAMLEQANVQDAASFSAPGASGFDEIAAAVVAGEGFDADAFRKALRQRLGATREPKLILRMAAIPRNAAGKVLRSRLSDLLMEELRRRAPPKP
jgi:long-chain acyl-CoA synthetase